MMTREEMLTDVIHKFGFEAQETVRFARTCETASQMAVEIFYSVLMAYDMSEAE